MSNVPKVTYHKKNIIQIFKMLFDYCYATFNAHVVLFKGNLMVFSRVFLNMCFNVLWLMGYTKD